MSDAYAVLFAEIEREEAIRRAWSKWRLERAIEIVGHDGLRDIVWENHILRAALSGGEDPKP